MIQFLENQYIEAIYQNNIYCRLQIVLFNDKKAFFTICASPGNFFISEDPMNLDISNLNGLKNSFIREQISQLENKDYININKIYNEKIDEINTLKDKFFFENPNIEGDELKRKWYRYKIDNLDIETIKIVDLFGHIKHKYNKLIISNTTKDEDGDEYINNENLIYELQKHFFLLIKKL